MLLNFKVIFNKHTNKIQKSEKKKYIPSNNNAPFRLYVSHFIDSQKKKNIQKPCEIPNNGQPFIELQTKKKNAQQKNLYKQMNIFNRKSLKCTNNKNQKNYKTTKTHVRTNV